jgi:hypothetical protein
LEGRIVIEIYTVEYLTDGRRDWINVYAYPSGGIGITASAPGIVEALGGQRCLIDGVSPDVADDAAQRLANAFAVLTDGEMSHSGVPTDYEDVD